MTVLQFWDRLLADNGYDTPADLPVAWYDRLLGRCDLWYHLRITAGVVDTSLRVRRHPLDQPLWRRQTYLMWRAVEGCGGRFHVRGMEHVKALNGPAVYVSNHMSMVETVVLPSLLLPFRLLSLIVKESLLHYPVFGPVMKAVRPIAVTRRDPREDLKQVLEQGARILNEEQRSVVVFPQATRSVVFDPSEFNSLGVKLARRAGVPVVPLALKTDFHGIGRVVRDFGRVDRSKTLCFSFGPPLRVAGSGREEHAQAVDFIAARLREWGGEVRERVAGTAGGEGESKP